MNYIKSLQDDLKREQEDKEAALATLVDLKRYLTSSKFTAAGDRQFLVSTQDVLDRIAPAISAVLA